MSVKPDRSNITPVNMKRSILGIDYGEGIYLMDEGGKRYIDACSGLVAANIGQGLHM